MRAKVKFPVKNALRCRRKLLTHGVFYCEFDFDSHDGSCSQSGLTDIPLSVVVTAEIFPHVASGFEDTVPAMREQVRRVLSSSSTRASQSQIHSQILRMRESERAREHLHSCESKANSQSKNAVCCRRRLFTYLANLTVNLT